MASNTSPEGLSESETSHEKIIFGSKRTTIQTGNKLSLQDLHPTDATAQFLKWLEEARVDPSMADNEPDLCTLATAELPSGRVSTRIVQLKGLRANGSFIFFTNFDTSRKATDLVTNAHVGLNFFWNGSSQRQVRIEGTARKLTEEESSEYFKHTSRRSRIASWASRQSTLLASGPPPTTQTMSTNGDDYGRVRLDDSLAEVEERFRDCHDIPMPPSWGVLEVMPTRVEFWQGRANRLHDRFVYEAEIQGQKDCNERDESKAKTRRWVISRLNP